MQNIPSCVRVKHSGRARRMALRLDAKERCVCLTVPRGVSLRKAAAFATEHLDWIEDRIRELPPPVPFEHGRILPIFGFARKITVIREADRKTTEISLLPDSLLVVTNKTDKAEISGRIERYLRTVAKEKLTALALSKAQDIRKKVDSIAVRDTKSRWGSCSEDDKLSFSWRLIFAPYLSMDYVVAHEVAHLRHLNHGKAFWSLCRELSLDYLEGEFWMRNHGHELMRFGQPK